MWHCASERSMHCKFGKQHAPILTGIGAVDVKIMTIVDATIPSNAIMQINIHILHFLLKGCFFGIGFFGISQFCVVLFMYLF